MSKWATLLKYGKQAANSSAAKTMGDAMIHPQRTLTGLGKATKTAVVGGGMGYLAWENIVNDKPIVRNGNIAVRYYFKDSLIGTSAGRTKIQNRADAIISALENNDYSVPYGPQNIGDVDDIGYGVLLIECYKGRVV